MKAGALSLLSVTVRMTFARPVKPLPSRSAACTSRVYFGYFCNRRDIQGRNRTVLVFTRVFRIGLKKPTCDDAQQEVRRWPTFARVRRDGEKVNNTNICPLLCDEKQDSVSVFCCHGRCPGGQQRALQCSHRPAGDTSFTSPL